MNTFAGLGAALRIALRRNRLFWILWVVGLFLLMPMTAQQYNTILPPGVDQRTIIEPLRHQAAMLALLGPAFDLYTKGGFVFWRVGGFTSMAAAMMGGFGIIRATRAEEEEGRVEVVRSGPVGRHAPLAAGLILGVVGNLALAALTIPTLIGIGLPVAGSVAAGLALSANGVLFTAIGAVLAQVFTTARSARYWTLGAGLGGMFLLRAMVDAQGSTAPAAWVHWLIPLEWPMLVRPFSDERWWVFALPLGLAVALTVVAFALESRRDHGAGLVQPRLGPASAPGYLGGTWGLAWRLQRGGLIGWTLALLVCSVLFGSIGANIDQLFRDDPAMQRLLQRIGGVGELRTAFYTAILSIMVLFTAMMAVTILARLRGEETRGHAEAMLATAVPRTRLALSHLSWATVLPVAVLVGVGAGLPLSVAASNGDWALLGDMTQGALGLIPGTLLVLGVAMFLLGWLPQLFGLAWAVLGWSIIASWFGVLFNFPDWVLKLQPWGHLAKLPAEQMNWAPFLIELGIAIALGVLGLIGYRRRTIVGR